MNSLINIRLSFVLLSSMLILLLSCSKDKDTAVNKSNKANIKSWEFGDKSARISGTDITITLSSGADITALTADVKLSTGAKISPDPSKDNDYTNPVTFTVTAEDGTTTKNYKVKVSAAKNNEVEIKSWKFGSEVATISGTDITISSTYGIDISSLTAVVQLSAGASISPDPTQSKDYTNAVTFTVTSEDGSTTKDYTVTVSVEDAIISWTAGWRDNDAYTANINQRSGKIDIDLNSAYFDTKVNLSAGVTINPDPNSVTDWTNEVTFAATKGSKTKTYKVKVKVNGKDIIKVTDANIKTKINTEIGKPNGNTANYNYIDVSSVTNMQELFKDKANFNGDISKWDVSKVTDMTLLFYGAALFNQDIGDWNVFKVISMKSMFATAATFNQDISNWNVSNVEDMRNMFSYALNFNQDIGKWNISNVTDMKSMFNHARSFNQNISSWNVGKVTSCSNFSQSTTAFQAANKPTFTACTE